MRNIILTITALLVVMAAMTGISAAATTVDFQVTNDPVIINVGETKTQTATLTLSPVVTGAIKKIEILDLPAGITTTIDGNPGTILTGPWTSTKSWTVDFTNSAAPNGEYIITYKVTYENDLVQTRRATIEAGVSAIPEFPTVALPVAAMIGIVFFFQHRKNRKD